MYNSNQWNSIYEDGYLALYPNSKIVSFVFRNFGKNFNQKREQTKILDIGAGGGNNTWFLAMENFDVYAVDGSSKAIELAEKRLKKLNLSATFSKYNLCNLQYEDNFFNGAIDDYCVQANNVFDVKKIFSEIYRVLKREGKYYGLFLCDTNHKMMQGEEIEPNSFTSTKGDRNARNRLVHFFGYNELKELCSPFSYYSIDKEIVTHQNQQETTQSWIVEAVK